MAEDSTYEKIKVGDIGGRYVCSRHMLPFLDRLRTSCKIKKVGISVQGRDIQQIEIGHGSVTVLMWSQMHGNESTTTKGVLDVINALQSGYDHADEILKKIRLVVIPILNPDGAEAYSRENANGIDLNRDAQKQTQPESVVLRKVFEKYQPDFCFNLHDQRTIFSAGPRPKPATLSFLSPSADETRSVTPDRLTAMKVISMMNRELQKYISGQVGRYDDAFNPNCVGDTFQMLRTPTILVEAGHFPGDYRREVTRQYVFLALWRALRTIARGDYTSEGQKGYIDIPENEKRFFDVLIRNPSGFFPESKEDGDLGLLYKEELESDSIRFRLHLEKQGDLSEYYGHRTFDCTDPTDLKKLKEDAEVRRFLRERKR